MSLYLYDNAKMIELIAQRIRELNSSGIPPHEIARALKLTKVQVEEVLAQEKSEKKIT